MKLTPEVKAAAVAAFEQFLTALENTTTRPHRTTTRAPARPDVEPTPEEIEQAQRALRRKAGV